MKHFLNLLLSFFALIIFTPVNAYRIVDQNGLPVSQLKLQASSPPVFSLRFSVYAENKWEAEQPFSLNFYSDKSGKIRFFTGSRAWKQEGKRQYPADVYEDRQWFSFQSEEKPVIFQIAAQTEEQHFKGVFKIITLSDKVLPQEVQTIPVESGSRYLLTTISAIAVSLLFFLAAFFLLFLKRKAKAVRQPKLPPQQVHEVNSYAWTLAPGDQLKIETIMKKENIKINGLKNTISVDYAGSEALVKSEKTRKLVFNEDERDETFTFGAGGKTLILTETVYTSPDKKQIHRLNVQIR